MRSLHTQSSEPITNLLVKTNLLVNPDDFAANLADLRAERSAHRNVSTASIHAYYGGTSL